MQHQMNKNSYEVLKGKKYNSKNSVEIYTQSFSTAKSHLFQVFSVEQFPVIRLAKPRETVRSSYKGKLGYTINSSYF